MPDSVKTAPFMECPEYDIKQSDNEATATRFKEWR